MHELRRTCYLEGMFRPVDIPSFSISIAPPKACPEGMFRHEYLPSLFNNILLNTSRQNLRFKGSDLMFKPFIYIYIYIHIYIYIYAYTYSVTFHTRAKLEVQGLMFTTFGEQEGALIGAMSRKAVSPVMYILYCVCMYMQEGAMSSKPVNFNVYISCIVCMCKKEHLPTQCRAMDSVVCMMYHVINVHMRANIACHMWYKGAMKQIDGLIPYIYIYTYIHRTGLDVYHVISLCHALVYAFPNKI
jgi:hypothetical protein